MFCAAQSPVTSAQCAPCLRAFVLHDANARADVLPCCRAMAQAKKLRRRVKNKVSARRCSSRKKVRCVRGHEQNYALLPLLAVPYPSNRVRSMIAGMVGGAVAQCGWANSRKYIQAMKRLMTHVQTKYSTDPSSSTLHWKPHYQAPPPTHTHRLCRQHTQQMVCRVRKDLPKCCSLGHVALPVRACRCVTTEADNQRLADKVDALTEHNEKLLNQHMLLQEHCIEIDKSKSQVVRERCFFEAEYTRLRALLVQATAAGFAAKGSSGSGQQAPADGLYANAA